MRRQSRLLLCGAGCSLSSAPPCICPRARPGALGRRTVYQEDPKAQLVVRATRGRLQQVLDQDPDVASFGFEPITQPQATGQAGGAAGRAGAGGSESAEAKVQARQPTHGMVDESDVLIAPKLVAEDGQVGAGIRQGSQQGESGG